MSCWIVSKKHVDVLVSALRLYKLIPADELDKTGALLWAENHTSYNYRYDEDTEVPAYAFAEPVGLTQLVYSNTQDPTTKPLDLNAVSVLKQVNCYEYQSCEHPGWAESRACRLMDALEAALHADSRGAARHTAAYEAAP